PASSRLKRPEPLTMAPTPPLMRLISQLSASSKARRFEVLTVSASCGPSKDIMKIFEASRAKNTSPSPSTRITLPPSPVADFFMNCPTDVDPWWVKCTSPWWATMAPLVAIIGAFGTITVRSIFFDWSVHRSWFWISALRLEKSSLLTFHGPFLRKDGIPHFYGCRIHNTCASHVHEVGACGHPGTCARTPEHARGIREHRHDCRHARPPEHMHA